jgi:hypothetical protein
MLAWQSPCTVQGVWMRQLLLAWQTTFTLHRLWRQPDLRGHSISNCGHLGNPKYDKYCTHCFRNLFPEDPRTAAIRTNSKEIKWVNVLLQSPMLGGFDWRHDKPFFVSFAGGCCDTKRRVDLWTIVGNVLLAIEIDEFEHKYRAADYKETRYNDLAMDFTARQVILILRRLITTSPGFESNAG